MKIEIYDEILKINSILNKLRFLIQEKNQEFIELTSELFQKNGFILIAQSQDQGIQERMNTVVISGAIIQRSKLVIKILYQFFPLKTQDALEIIKYLENLALKNSVTRIDILISKHKSSNFSRELKKMDFRLITHVFEKNLPFSKNLIDVLELIKQLVIKTKIKNYHLEIGMKNPSGQLKLVSIDWDGINYKGILKARPVLVRLIVNNSEPTFLFAEHSKDTIKWDDHKMLFSKNLSYSVTSMT